MVAICWVPTMQTYEQQRYLKINNFMTLVGRKNDLA